MASLSTQLNIAMSEYVYESPDNGKTVYRRKIGSNDRYLHSTDPELQATLNEMHLSKEWQRIRELARDDPALQDMVDQLRVYYRLKYEQQI